jgi:predicted Zn-dependent protease with MMP-like domain
MSRAIEKLLDEAWAAVDAGRLAKARSLARRASNGAPPGLRAEALHVLGRVELELEHPDDAVRLLAEAERLGADWPDLFYDLGLAHEALGDDAAMRRAFLEVWERDPAYDRELRIQIGEDELVEIAERLLAELPDEMRRRLEGVPIIVEDRPTRDLVAEGFDPRALGLFDGPPWSEQGLTGPQLNSIALYRVNIAASCRSRAEAEEEVRITLLHETAHFFGVEEDAMEDMGLA